MKMVAGDLTAFAANPLAYVEQHTLGNPRPHLARFGLRQVAFVAQPSAVRHILVDNAENYGKGVSQARLRPLLGEGLITAEGDRWKASRKALAGRFTGAALDEGLNLAIAQAMRDICRLSTYRGQPIDLPAFTGQLTIRMASAAMYLDSLPDDLASDLYEAAASAHHWVTDVMWAPVYFPWMPGPTKRKLTSLNALLSRVVDHLAESPKGVLAALGPVEKVYGKQALRDEFVTLTLAGFETTASTASWLMYLLASHPEVVDWMRAEVDPILDGGADLTPQTLRRMQRTRAVVDEVMRLYPATWWFAREAKNDDVIDGVRIRAGVPIFITPWTLHRQAELWNDAGSFRPERFMEGEQDKFSYIPFGLGARACLGQHLARAELMIMAALIVSSFDLLPCSGAVETLKPVGGITLAPPKEGLAVRAMLRSCSFSQSA